MTINVSCSACSASFPVDPAKIPEGGVKARCSSCGSIFFVEKPAHFDSPGGEGVTPDQVTAPSATAEAPATPESPPTPESSPSVPEAGVEEEPGVDATTVPDVSGPSTAESAESAETEAATDFASGDESDDDWVVERGPGMEVAEPIEVEDEPSTADEPAVTEEPSLAEEAPVAEQPSLAEEAPVGEEPEASVTAGPGAAQEVVPEDEIEPEEGDPAEGAAPDTLPSPSAPPQGFQFGKRDPHDKARRLARVLVSDMIMYNPERHTRALEQGTLKDDFEDEIEKSWEEYVEQVGDEMAESTTYFTDALNEVLAKGEQIFSGPPAG